MPKLNIPLPSKGLVVDRPGEFVDTQSALNIKNMEYNRAIIRTKQGSSLLGSTMGERIQRYMELQVGPLTRLVRIGLTKVQEYNKATQDWLDMQNAALTGASGDIVDFAFPLLSGTKIGVYTNGIDNIRKFSVSGNDADLGGSPPKCKFLRQFGPYLVLANVTDSGNNFYSRVQWCDTGNPESWTPGGGSNAGSEDLLEDPEDLSGVGLFGSALTFHKAKSITVGQLVSTSNVIQFDRKATGVGAVANGSICSLPSGEEIFLAADGFHLFIGVTAPLVDSPVQDELREELNPLYSYKAQAIVVAELDEYWCAVPIGSDAELRTIYKYNWRTQQMYKDDRIDLTAIGLFLNTTQDTWNDRTLAWDADNTRWSSVLNLANNPVVIYGNTDGESSRRISSSSEDGEAIESIWDTKDFVSGDFGLPDSDLIMRFTKLSIWAKGTRLKIYYSTDGGSSWTLITNNGAQYFSLSADYPEDDAPIEVYFDATKSRCRFRFYNGDVNQNFTLKKYIVEATPREARK